MSSSCGAVKAMGGDLAGSRADEYFGHFGDIPDAFELRWQVDKAIVEMTKQE